MFARALIVLLLVLNVGVATWWIVRDPPAPPAVEQPAGVTRLRLLSEAPRRRSTPPTTLPPPERSADKAVPVDALCFSFGPFTSAAAIATARARLQPLSVRIAMREQYPSPVRGWRVQLPPQATPDAAQAMAKRIADAGFSDLLIVRDGPDANAIALGRYRSEETARRRAAALIAAGFAAKVEPLGDVKATTWIDLAAAPGFDAAAAQAAAAAPQRNAIDCARLR